MQLHGAHTVQHRTLLYTVFIQPSVERHRAVLLRDIAAGDGANKRMLLPVPGQRYGEGYRVLSIDAEAQTAKLACGTEIHYDALINTAPLDITLRWLGQPKWADTLSHRQGITTLLSGSPPGHQQRAAPGCWGSLRGRRGKPQDVFCGCTPPSMKPGRQRGAFCSLCSCSASEWGSTCDQVEPERRQLQHACVLNKLGCWALAKHSL